MRRLGQQRLEALLAIAGIGDVGEAELLQRRSRQRTDCQLIVDDENFDLRSSRHYAISLAAGVHASSTQP